jgi:hypothetical protein
MQTEVLEFKANHERERNDKGIVEINQIPSIPPFIKRLVSCSRSVRSLGFFFLVLPLQIFILEEGSKGRCH